MKAYTIGLYEKAMPNTLSWKEKLEAAKEAGYDFVEISIDETDEKLARLDWSASERLELVRTMEKIGVPIRSMCLSGHRKYPLGSPSEATRARSMEIMEKAIALADDLGIRVIQLAGYDVYYEEGTEETRRLFGENLEKAVEMASRRSVVLGFETMETEFMNTVEKSMKYVDAVNSLYLLLDLDKDDFCKIVDTIGLDRLIAKRRHYDRLLRAEEMLTAQERYEDAKRRLDALDREREQLQEMVDKYQATHKI